MKTKKENQQKKPSNTQNLRHYQSLIKTIKMHKAHHPTNKKFGQDIILITLGGGAKIEPKTPAEDEAAVVESLAPKRSDASEEPDCFPSSILSLSLNS